MHYTELIFPSGCTHIYNGVCYVFHDQYYHGYQAENLCENRGGKLVEICDTGLNELLKQTAVGKPFVLKDILK